MRSTRSWSIPASAAWWRRWSGTSRFSTGAAPLGVGGNEEEQDRGGGGGHPVPRGRPEERRERRRAGRHPDGHPGRRHSVLTRNHSRRRTKNDECPDETEERLGDDRRRGPRRPEKAIRPEEGFPVLRRK